MLLLCNYYVTYKCNAYCEFCHFADHEKFNNTPFAALNDFTANTEQLSSLGVKFIDLTGGEPLLNKNIHHMAQFAKQLGMQTSITTNTLLYSKFAEQLAGNVNLLHFSLDSPDEDEHNNIRRVNCYKSVFTSIEIAKSLGEFPDIIFTVTNSTFKKLPQMYDIAVKHDLILLVNPVFSYFGNPGLSLEALDFIEEFIEGKFNIYMNRAFLKLRRDGGNDIQKPLCKAVTRVIVISPNNEVILPCFHFAEAKILIDKPISEIRKLDILNYYKQNEGKLSFCQGCTVNCYFEPSFAFPSNLYSLLSLDSKFKYTFNKLVKQKIQKKVKKLRTAK